MATILDFRKNLKKSPAHLHIEDNVIVRNRTVISDGVR